MGSDGTVRQARTQHSAVDSLLGRIGRSEAATVPRTPLKDQFQQAIITIHRWVGIVACLYFVVWFVSGLVLAYVRWPAMDSAEKLAVLKPLDWRQVQVMPDKALAAAGMSEFPRELRLEMSGGKPVYRITDWKKRHHTVSAATGQPIAGVSANEALRIVREQLSAPGATLAKSDLHRDQWTVTGYWNKERPFHLIHMNDRAGTQYYVSVATGEIVLDTRRYERVWNWVGAIPHWLYFEMIRWDTPVWQWTVYIAASVGIFVAVSGLWIGFSRLRLRARYANGKASPFTGWMKWHHVSGVIGGLFLAAWITSGLLTMYPGGFLEKRDIEKVEYTRYAGSQSAAFVAPALAEAQVGAAKRITYRWVGGEPIVVLEDGLSKPRMLDAATGRPRTLSVDQIAQAARAMMPHSGVVSATLLRTGDEYWHSGFYAKKLPVVRVAFADPAGTWFHMDPETGEVLGMVDDTGRVDRWSVVAIHDIDWGWLLAHRPWWDLVLFGVTLPGLLISITALTISFRRLQRTNLLPASASGVILGGRSRPASKAGGHTPLAARSDAMLVAYASQTGTAQALAEKTAESLRDAGLKVALRDLGHVDAAVLAEVRRAIFIVATAGDGDAPDHAMAFERRVMRRAASLQGLEYALLALGDRQYRVFCGFGASLHRWLQAGDARPLFAPVEVHDLDPGALSDWSRQLGAVTGHLGELVVERAPFEPWRLVERRHMNPGSAGWPVFHLELEPVSGSAHWEAGDIAQVATRPWPEFVASAEIAEREFSIASTSADGRLHLLIRQMRNAHGELGVASALLTDRAAIGDEIPLRVRRNAGFHPPADDRPMILVGNGTGLAGLRAHIRRRVALGHKRNWLIFGERNAAADAFYAGELQALREHGELERLDLVFSRDQPVRRYVQHQLDDAADEVRAWVARGAAIYVCGSLNGMASAVTETLVAILGEDGFEALTQNGGYRRDVY
jgi:sulfite reductase (NADPH) flavoprotein alpha-component